MLQLERIYLYPVKGARRVSLKKSRVEVYGLQGDRRWMLVDAKGRAVSQRQYAALALVHARITPTGLEFDVPDSKPLRVPRPEGSGVRIRTRIWSDTVDALDGGEDAGAWFSRLLGAPCRLVYMDDGALRAVDTTYYALGGSASFSDGYPLLLTSTASLEMLNGHLAEPVAMTRFRPNLVIKGGKPFDEDSWSRVRIGSMVFHVVKPCTRCVVTTVDQETGVQGKEPLRTLNLIRRRGGNVFFGENLIPDDTGILRVGDAVEVVARRTEWPIRTD